MTYKQLNSSEIFWTMLDAQQRVKCLIIHVNFQPMGSTLLHWRPPAQPEMWEAGERASSGW